MSDIKLLVLLELNLYGPWTILDPDYFPFITQQYGKDAERIIIVFIFGSRVDIK